MKKYTEIIPRKRDEIIWTARIRKEKESRERQNLERKIENLQRERKPKEREENLG